MSDLRTFTDMLKRADIYYRILDLYTRGAHENDLPSAYRVVVGNGNTLLDFDAKTGALLSVG